MMEFDWDDHNRDHVGRHNIAPQEAEEVILNDPIDLDYEDINGEWRIQQIGETLARRVLVIVTMERGDKIRVVTGFEPPRSARVDYLQARRLRDAR